MPRSHRESPYTFAFRILGTHRLFLNPSDDIFIAAFLREGGKTRAGIGFGSNVSLLKPKGYGPNLSRISSITCVPFSKPHNALFVDLGP